MPLRPPRSPRRRRAGFSLVEVALALVIAAGGLLSVFGVFPVSLRQSQMSRSDMSETGFASALLQTFGGRIRDIDDIAVWNDPKQFWKAAAKGSGLPETLSDSANGSKHVYELHQDALEGVATARPFSPLTTFVASGYENQSKENIWYFGREDFEGSVPDNEKLVLPAQYLVRLACIRRTANRVVPKKGKHPGGNRQGTIELENGAVSSVSAPLLVEEVPGGAVLPNIYVISVVSTDRGFPDTFIREPVFSQEFTFVHRP